MRIKEIIDARNRMSKQANEARTSWCKKYLSADARQNYTEKYISEKLSAELAEIAETEHSANVRFNEELVAESEALFEAAKRKIVPILHPKTERDVIRAGADVYVKEYADGYDEITGQARMLELAESEVV